MGASRRTMRLELFVLLFYALRWRSLVASYHSQKCTYVTPLIELSLISTRGYVVSFGISSRHCPVLDYRSHENI
ncbi:hypothetical protein BDZ89DRAFT_816400 [Hymenopellis radicata]|nr:hypothetical protein BDZ89DRAFT_816400 [Hymenopellis radicata]